MRMIFKTLIPLFIIATVLSGSCFCKAIVTQTSVTTAVVTPEVVVPDAVTTEVLVNGKALAGARNVVLFAKLNKVVIVNPGESAKQKKYELFGRVEFGKSSEVFDALYSKGSKFTMTYRTQTTLEAQSLTFAGCKVYKKDKSAGLVTYRIKAEDLK